MNADEREAVTNACEEHQLVASARPAVRHVAVAKHDGDAVPMGVSAPATPPVPTYYLSDADEDWMRTLRKQLAAEELATGVRPRFASDDEQKVK